MHAFLTSIAPKFSEDSDTLVVHPEKSIGIDEIRTIQKFLGKKPLLHPPLVIINSAHLMTIPAQNAFLKTLEEPPTGTSIYLITSEPNLLLPTIRSRVFDQKAPSKETPSIDKLTNLCKKDYLSRIKLLDSLSLDKSSAQEFLIELESSIHHNLKLSTSYKIVSNAKKYLSKNANPKLVLDFLAMNLPAC